jgi:hypothetical protein
MWRMTFLSQNSLQSIILGSMWHKNDRPFTNTVALEIYCFLFYIAMEDGDGSSLEPNSRFIPNNNTNSSDIPSERRRPVYSFVDDAVEMSHVGRGSSSARSGISTNEDENNYYEIMDDDDSTKYAESPKGQPKPKKESREILDRLNPHIKQTKSLGRMSQMLARVSSRVVNIANVPRGQQEKVEMETPLPPRTSSRKYLEEFYATQNRLPTTNSDKLNMGYKISPEIPLEDRSLYIFTPKNPIRLWLHGILTHPYVMRIFILGLHR